MLSCNVLRPSSRLILPRYFLSVLSQRCKILPLNHLEVSPRSSHGRFKENLKIRMEY